MNTPHLNEFLAELNLTSEYDTFMVKTGTKFHKVIRYLNHNVQSAYCFINKETGDILKTDTWSRPAKGARGNLLDKSSWSGKMDSYGSWLYRR